MADTSTRPSFEQSQDLSYTDIVAQAGDTFVGALTEAQDQILKTTQSMSSALPKPETVTIPGSDHKLPSPSEVIEANFDFVFKVLANQKAYAQKFLTATSA